MSCKQIIPSSLCKSPAPPNNFEDYNKDVTCHCRCSKNIKLDIFIIYDILKKLSLDVSNIGDVVTYALDYWNFVGYISYADLFLDPRMNEGNETLIAHGGNICPCFSHMPLTVINYPFSLLLTLNLLSNTFNISPSFSLLNCLSCMSLISFLIGLINNHTLITLF